MKNVIQLSLLIMEPVLVQQEQHYMILNVFNVMLATVVRVKPRMSVLSVLGLIVFLMEFVLNVM